LNIKDFINQIICGDCIEVMKTLPDNSVDAVVTDPPYGLEFMGKNWDKFKAGKNIAGGNTGKDTPYARSKPAPAFYQLTQVDKLAFQKFNYNWSTEALRVLKPGGYLLAFGSTRTYHRLVCGIEDAGFEIRDTIMWLYGSGFPKSLDISKNIDKRGGNSVGWFGKWLREWRNKRGISSNEIGELFPSKTGSLTGCVRNWELGFNLPTSEQFSLIVEKFNLPFKTIEEAEREIIGKDKNWGEKGSVPLTGYKEFDITLPATPEAKQWAGWGTALKPACEPIVVARKPLSESTVAENVLKWGTGGIDIDGGRIGHNEPLKETNRQKNMGNSWDSSNCGLRNNPNNIASANPQGRFPANVILDEEAGAMLDEMSGTLKSGSNNIRSKEGFFVEHGGLGKAGDIQVSYGDTGGASRFFYCAKASKSERNRGCENLYWLNGKLTIKEIWEKLNKENELNKDNKNFKRHNIARGNIHPTVKSLSLMEYLIILYSRKGAIILDPFCGSGTTAMGCINTGRKYIVIDNEKEYIEIAKCRVRAIPELLF